MAAKGNKEWRSLLRALRWLRLGGLGPGFNTTTATTSSFTGSASASASSSSSSSSSSSGRANLGSLGREMYEASMTACLAAKRTNLVGLLLERMKEDDGLAPGFGCYKLAVLALCKQEKAREARALLTRMHLEGVLQDGPTQDVSNLYLNVVTATKPANVGDLIASFELVRDMRRKGFTPTAALYSAVIKPCFALGKVDLGLKLINEQSTAYYRMREAFLSDPKLRKRRGDYIPLLETRAAALHAMMLQGCDWEQAEKVLRTALDMHKREELQGSPEELYHRALSACASKSAPRASEARKLLEEMKAHGYKPGSEQYAHVIRACAIGGDWSAAQRAFEEANRSVETLSPAVVATFITACMVEGKSDEAISLLSKLKISLERHLNISVDPDDEGGAAAAAGSKRKITQHRKIRRGELTELGQVLRALPRLPEGKGESMFFHIIDTLQPKDSDFLVAMVSPQYACLLNNLIERGKARAVMERIPEIRKWSNRCPQVYAAAIAAAGQEREWELVCDLVREIAKPSASWQASYALSAAFKVAADLGKEEEIESMVQNLHWDASRLGSAKAAREGGAREATCR